MKDSGKKGVLLLPEGCNGSNVIGAFSVKSYLTDTYMK